MVTGHLEMAEISVETVKATKPTFILAIKGGVCKLVKFRKTLKTFILAMEAIPAQLKTIEEQEELMHTQIQGALGNIFEDIKNNKTIGDVLGIRQRLGSLGRRFLSQWRSTCRSNHKWLCDIQHTYDLTQLSYSPGRQS